METDKKVRSAINYFRKNTLKRYFHVWMKYTAGRKQRLKNNLTERRPCGSFAPTPSVQFDRSTLDPGTVENVANEQEEIIEPVEAAIVPLVPTIDVADLNKTIKDELNKHSAKLWLLLLNRVFKLWKKYSIFVLNKNHGEILVINVKRSQNSKKNTIMVYRALVLLKTAWEIWYMQCIDKSIL